MSIPSSAFSSNELGPNPTTSIPVQYANGPAIAENQAAPSFSVETANSSVPISSQITSEYVSSSTAPSNLGEAPVGARPVVPAEQASPPEAAAQFATQTSPPPTVASQDEPALDFTAASAAPSSITATSSSTPPPEAPSTETQSAPSNENAEKPEENATDSMDLESDPQASEDKTEDSKVEETIVQAGQNEEEVTPMESGEA